ncbi:MAG: chromosome segregation protein SMC [Anaerolineae bacterium]
MRLKRLELYGYKSFATRNVFEFGEGIAAIVGPNGSGKSNIADAVRWVMGEQSYSSLRAKTTEDMIFAGSKHRARQGMAEVLMVLDNSDGRLPLDFTEVSVGRRAFRSGENEYLLNGNRVRYRDVLEVFGSAGLMKSGYTVIGQGLVDAALSLRPEARRALFEEAAGISPQLRKKADALKRIEETEHNLERVNDIVNELMPRARALRRQAERAEEHALLRQDLSELQRIWYGYQWQRRQRQVLQAEEQLKKQAALLEAQRSYARSFQQRMDALAARLAEQRGRIESLSAAQASIRDEAEGWRRELAVSEERMRLYQQQHTALAGEMQTLASRREILQAEIDKASREMGEFETAVTSGRSELEAERAKLAELDAQRRSVERAASAEQAGLNQATAQVAELRIRLEQLAERQATQTAERDKALASLAEMDKRREALAAQEAQLVARERALQESLAELRRQQAAASDALPATREQVAAAERAVARFRSERERLVERHNLLSRLRQELTGFHPGVREVLAASDKLPGLLGTVVSLMQVPAELETAIESALGPRLQNVVTERWEHAEAAIEHLKRTRAGWATFLPLDTVRSRPALTLRAEPGVVGVASALVRFEERLRPVFDLLLGSVVITQDLATARRLLDRRTGASLFVTLEGETVQPSGALSGGSQKRASNLLAQEREWRGLPDQIESAEGELQEAQRALAAAQATLADQQRQIADLERQANRMRPELDAAHQAVAGHAQDQHELERECKWRKGRAEQSDKELADLAAREQPLRAKLTAAQAAELAASEHLRGLREKLAAGDDETLRQRVGQLETRYAVAERTLRSQRTLIESHHANLAQLDRQIEEKHAQDDRLAEQIEELGRHTEEVRGLLGEAQGRVAGLRQESEPAAKALTALESERQELEKQHGQALERLNEAEIEYNRIALGRDRTRDELAALSRDIEEDLGPIDIPNADSQQLRLDLGDDVIELPDVPNVPPGLGDDIRQLKARIRRLGDVNPNAPHEYEQLLDRQTFLQSQAADLRGAIASLHEVIQELDTIIERDFGATIQQVDRSFGEYFTILFGGGSASLVLTDPDDLSRTGVDIVARPPGKRPQTLSLLSGGERALTAVALLFALLRANPVPFCFLDEVDAALDEANVVRFRQLLEQHSDATQFIVITHNRRTIEAAGTIYGISMGEQGVSSCISLKLMDEAADLSATGA